MPFVSFVVDSDSFFAATRAVILRLGFRATSADVAAEAGVSEGTLFKRFGTKEELFRAALELGDDLPVIVKELPLLVGKGDLRETLVSVSKKLIDYAVIVRGGVALPHAFKKTTEKTPHHIEIAQKRLKEVRP